MHGIPRGDVRALEHRVLVGRALMAWRVAEGLTGAELAKLLGVSHSLLKHWEYGTQGIPPGRLLQLSELGFRAPAPAQAAVDARAWRRRR